MFLGRKEQAKPIANGKKPDEDMWVPSDLESESQRKKDGGSSKIEKDLGNSGGELLSEGELLSFLVYVMENNNNNEKNNYWTVFRRDYFRADLVTQWLSTGTIARKVAGSISRPDHHSGSENNWGESNL